MRILLIILITFISTASRLHSEDLQAAWIASVININFPSKPGLTVAEQKSEIIALLDSALSAGLNAVILQVRPESDTLYKSDIEPWSRFLTGTQGTDPGYDPLATFIEEAKKRDISVHAWLNPFRAAISAQENSTAAKNHISRKFPEHVKKVDNKLWMDPASTEVRAHIVSVIEDILKRYDVAGIHFDDYFYPYPKDGKPADFDDWAMYAAYKKNGGRMKRDDWRRDNINQLVKAVSQSVRTTKPGAVFGISPFGIYRKNTPRGIKAGVDQYSQLFADPPHWMKEGWIDYLSPQLYWEVEGPQSFKKLLTWWRSPDINPKGVAIYPGIAIYRLESHGWKASEILNQLSLEQTTLPRKSGGFILWNIKAVQNNTKGVKEIIRKF